MSSTSPTLLNLMLGRGRGGLEQAVHDYAEALAHADIPTVTVLSPRAWINDTFNVAGMPYHLLANRWRFDVLAVLRLRRLARATHATAVICHGNRALALALRALKGRIPIIAVAHNASVRRFVHADHCLSITEYAAENLTKMGIANVTHMPNAVRIPTIAARPPYRKPPVIGTMGRFVPKKGFDVYIQALALLKQRGIAFHALLGGEGMMVSKLKEQIAAAGLHNEVEFIGWVQDKAAFFQRLDIFVLPSLIEAFGIVLIEAMAYGAPVITSDTDGPREIIHHGQDGLIIARGDATQLADALQELIENPARAQQLAEAGKSLVSEEYTLPAMGARLKTALAPYIKAA